MQASFRINRDILSPDLQKLYRNASDKIGLHQALGVGLAGLGKRAFNDASLRPSSWAAKKDGTASRLRKTGTLAKSVRVTSVTAKGVSVGSDRKYAAIHQLGGKTKAHIIRPKNKKALAWPGMKGGPFGAVKHPGSKTPARPYLPFDKTGRPTPKAIAMIRSVSRARLMKGTTQA